MLSEWAPRLLRALYDRDVRRPYCQPLLWLAPYVEMFGSEDAVPREWVACWVVSGGVVCEALCCGARGERTVNNSANQLLVPSSCCSPPAAGPCRGQQRLLPSHARMPYTYRGLGTAR